MKDRDLHTREADVTLWSDGKSFSKAVLGCQDQDLSLVDQPATPENLTEEAPVEEKLTKVDMALGFTIALFSGVVLAALIYAVSIGIVGLMRMLGGHR